MPGVIRASAPVRICDNGGWTDTWFGGPGRVLNVAVAPGVEVTIQSGGRSGVTLDVADLGDRYPVAPSTARISRHPLLEGAIDRIPPPVGTGVEIRIRSAVPPGCSTGTSAAVTVALLGALTALQGRSPVPLEIAYAAHGLEVDLLGGESGIQDQLSCALGGINFLEIDAYPDARIESLPLWDSLDRHLSVVYLGRSHQSSAVHREVIDSGGPARAEALAGLRAAALAARRAVLARDLIAFGRSLVDNTEAQVALHPGLVGPDASRVIGVASAAGALGWKVNGAGGEGGSVSILSPTTAIRTSIERRVAALDPAYRILAVRLSPSGLQVTGSL